MGPFANCTQRAESRNVQVMRVVHPFAGYLLPSFPCSVKPVYICVQTLKDKMKNGAIVHFKLVRAHWKHKYLGSMWGDQDTDTTDYYMLGIKDRGVNVFK